MAPAPEKEKIDEKRKKNGQNVNLNADHAHCLSNVQPNLPVNKVVVHPLVLLSVVDHFNRVNKTHKVSRVVGVLLGCMKPDKTLDIANCFAVPYDEDSENSNIFFLDADFLEDMFGMFYKVAARERIVGWYHSGPRLCKNDILINEVIKRFTPNPVLIIIQASQGRQDLALPTDSYVEVQEVHNDGSPPVKTFEHVPSEIGAEEAEEVGVEHLLRDIKNQTAGTLSQRISNQMTGIRGLENHLAGITSYLHRVASRELPINHAIIFLIQEMLNLLPEVLAPDFVDAHNVQTNDHLMSVYIGTMVRTVIALHNLIDNKLTLQKVAEKTSKEKLTKETEKKESLTEKDETKEKETVRKP
uniref:MPN domain-containing protein n=1 Tax=Globodera pallida TaxID=36090 RepID=A0A183CPL2_GLOPA